jgi:flagellar motor switch protein FliM
VPTNINIMQIRPLRGNSLFIFDPKLVFTVIDNLFGGSGKFQTRIEGRDFTITEQRIIQRMLEVVYGEYEKAWAGVYPLKFEYARSEVHTQFANIATPSEIVVTTSFTIDLGESSGEMFICIPYATLEPIRDMLYTSLQGDSQEPDKRWLSMLKRQVQIAELELVAELATTTATVSQLLRMSPGDFIELDMIPTVPVKVSGVPLLEGRYGVMNGHYAIKVEQFLSQAPECESIPGVQNVQ